MKFRVEFRCPYTSTMNNDDSSFTANSALYNVTNVPESLKHGPRVIVKLIDLSFFGGVFGVEFSSKVFIIILNIMSDSFAS